ncbi:hypothetical protein GQR58_030121 [Nymphon striatum]|nr:hypothetical protein GQR58_030121 [Nymphon striatum]
MGQTFTRLIALVLAMSFVMSSCGAIGSSSTVEVVGPSLQPRAEAGLPRSSATPVVDSVEPGGVEPVGADGEGFVLNLPGSDAASDVSFFSSTTAQLESASSYRFEVSVGMDIGDLSARLHIPEGTVIANGGYVDGRTLTQMDMGTHVSAASTTLALAAITAQEAGGATQLDPLLALQDGWVKMDANLLGGEDLASLAGGQMGSADGMIEMLSGVGGTVEDLGAAVIGDTPARHLRTTTSLAAMLEAQGQTDSLESMSLGDAVVRNINIPFDIWLDEDGRLLRLEMSMDLVDVVRGAGVVGGIRGVAVGGGADFVAWVSGAPDDSQHRGGGFCLWPERNGDRGWWPSMALLMADDTGKRLRGTLIRYRRPPPRLVAVAWHACWVRVVAPSRAVTGPGLHQACGVARVGARRVDGVGARRALETQQVGKEVGHAVVVVRPGNSVGDVFHLVVGVCHGNTQASPGQHVEVVPAVAECHHLGGFDSLPGAEPVQGAGLGDIGGRHHNERETRRGHLGVDGDDVLHLLRQLVVAQLVVCDERLGNRN